MKVVIAGSRSISEKFMHHISHVETLVDRFENEYGKISMIVSGHAAGPDKIGEIIAKRRGIQLAVMKAEWEIYKKAAGPIRNNQMADLCDAGIIVWDGHSKGTKHMTDALVKRGKSFILDVYEPTHLEYHHQPDGTIKIVTPNSVYKVL